MNPFVRLCVSMYRRLARTFPHEFQMVYGEELERLGEEAAPEIWRRHGLPGLLRLLGDIAIRLPIEYLAELRQDARYATRTIARSPGFATVVVLSLALGIGVCTMFFVQVDWMTRPLPVFRDPQALVAVETPVSHQQFEYYRDQRGVAESVAAFAGPLPFGVAINRSDSGEAERIFGHVVSPEYFSTLGVEPAAGRFFGSVTQGIDDAAAVVISHQFWRVRMNSDAGVVGRTLRVNGKPATIIGVGPEGFAGVWPITPAEIFISTKAAPFVPELAENTPESTDARIFHVVLRLAPGVTRTAAETALDTATRTFIKDAGIASNDQSRQVRLILAGGVGPFTEGQRISAYSVSIVLGGLVLLLACANLSNLILARGSDRRREIAIRLSVGASRVRLVRQFLTESLMLAMAGAIGALLFAYLLLGYMTRVAASAAGQTPLEYGYHLDFRSVLLTFGITLLGAVGFGLAPALASTRTGLAEAFKTGAAELPRYRRFGLRNLLVGSQVAASLTILLLTAYIAFGFESTARIGPGFDTSRIHLFQLDPQRDGYSPEQTAALFEKLPERLARIGRVTLAETVPMAELHAYPNVPITVPQHAGTAQSLASVVRQRVGAGYFETLDVPILRGRDFEPRDLNVNSDATVPAILNQTAAHALFGDVDPIGRILAGDRARYTVVGIARDTKSAVLMARAAPTMFVPMPLSGGGTVLLRSFDTANVMDSVRSELAAESLTIFNARTMNDHLDNVRSSVKVGSVFYMGLGAFGLILAAIGLAGVTAYAVVRRKKEIGIRMALGAHASQVLQLVLREGAALVIVGSVLGLFGAWGASRALAGTLDELARAFDSSAGNPVLLVGAPLLLAGIALAACYIPARRSARIDPLIALREE